jgi:hypothetical protein
LQGLLSLCGEEKIFLPLLGIEMRFLDLQPVAIRKTDFGPHETFNNTNIIITYKIKNVIENTVIKQTKHAAINIGSVILAN